MNFLQIRNWNTNLQMYFYKYRFSIIDAAASRQVCAYSFDKGSMVISRSSRSGILISLFFISTSMSSSCIHAVIVWVPGSFISHISNSNFLHMMVTALGMCPL